MTPTPITPTSRRGPTNVRNNPTRSWLTSVAASVAPIVAMLALVLVGVPAARADSGALLTWTKLAPSAAPAARLNAATAFDAATGTTVLFGGQAGSQILGDTWTWNGSTWTLQNPAVSPPPLAAAAMAYDNIGHRVILFGGQGSDGTASRTTWAWDGTTWAQLSPATVPPARYLASIAADSVTGTDVLFGGQSAPGSVLGDTWSWDGTNWTSNTTTSSPMARSAAAATFDAVRGDVVLFGGTVIGATEFGGAAGSSTVADTWTWDGTNWTQHASTPSPPPRSDGAFGFDPGTEMSVLFGGSGANGGALGDTWLWNGTSWSTSIPLSLLPTLSPPARIGASLATAPGNQRLILFGGQPGASATTALADTWKVATLVSGPTSGPSTTVGTAAGSSTTGAGSTTSSTTVDAAGSSTTSVPTTPTTKAPSVPPLVVKSSSVDQGAVVQVSGSGFVPGTTITITLHSVSVVVGTAIADAEGRFSTTVLVPADVPPGPHHLEATGAAQSGGQATLTAQVSVMLPGGKHGGWLLPAIMVALTVLLAAGAGVVLTASTRWHSRPAS